MNDEIATLESARVASARRKKLKEYDDRSKDTEAQKTPTHIYCTSFDSRIGRIYVASTEKGVCKISVPRETRKDFFLWLEAHLDLEGVVDSRSRNREVIDQLNRYFNGKLVRFTIPVDLIGTPFQIRVWTELARIPYGTTITYRHLAKRVAASSAYQAVGRANAANPLPIIYPCHRVLGADGSLVGYSCGIKTKEFLLRLEGAIIL